jgi:hypothetical protein
MQAYYLGNTGSDWIVLSGDSGSVAFFRKIRKLRRMVLELICRLQLCFTDIMRSYRKMSKKAPTFREEMNCKRYTSYGGMMF